MKTPSQAAERWQRAMRAYAQLGFSGQDSATLLEQATARGAKCVNCGAPYRPDPRSKAKCAYCGAYDWRQNA